MMKVFLSVLALLAFTLFSGCNRDEEPELPEIEIPQKEPDLLDRQNHSDYTLTERYSEKKVPVGGTPFNVKIHTNYQRYTNLEQWKGETTKITAQLDGSELHVLWLNQDNDFAMVSVFNQNLDKTTEIAILNKPVWVLGFEVIPGQGYAIVYTTKDQPDDAFLMLTDYSGTEQSNELVVGTENRSVKGARWIDPGIEGRLSYNDNLETLTYYSAQRGQWGEDGVDDIHQAGVYKTFDKTGKNLFYKDWFKGHIFGVRATELNNRTIIGINSDANPLGVGCVIADADNEFTDVEVFKCSWRLGAYIETHIGGMAAFPEMDQFAISYTGQEVVAATNTYDVGVSFYSATGGLISNLILPRPEGKEGKDFGINPVKMTRFGDDKVLTAWVQKDWDDVDDTGAYFAVSNAKGELVMGPEAMGDLAFHISDDFFVYPNGNIGWIEGDGTQLSFNIIKVH